MYTVCCAFKYGGVASGWGIDKVLSAMYKIFDQSPSRRADYERLNDEVYPLQFCLHQWAENEKVAVRAIAVWKNIRIVVTFWMTLPKSKQLSEVNESYICLKATVTDSLMLVKFKFFANTAKVLNKFLVAYQTEKPMVPFLAHSIEDIRSFSSMFLLKEDTLNKANTCLLLSKLHFKDRAIQNMDRMLTLEYL